MGSLTRLDLAIYDCDIFFETGTGTGASLLHALNNGRFEKLYSVEIHPRTAERASLRFQEHANLKIINSDSASALRSILPEIHADSKILFFFDAHFPGEVDKEFGGYKNLEPNSIKLPLSEELTIVRQFRERSEDVIIIDDLRIYEDGPFEQGNMPDWAETLAPHDKNIDFIYKIFPNRDIQKYYRDQGYILISPQAQRLRLKELPSLSQLKWTMMANLRKLLYYLR